MVSFLVERDSPTKTACSKSLWEIFYVCQAAALTQSRHSKCCWAGDGIGKRCHQGGLPAALAGALYKKFQRPKPPKSLRLTHRQLHHPCLSSPNLISSRDGPSHLPLMSFDQFRRKCHHGVWSGSSRQTNSRMRFNPRQLKWFKVVQAEGRAALTATASPSATTQACQPLIGTVPA